MYGKSAFRGVTLNGSTSKAHHNKHALKSNTRRMCGTNNKFACNAAADEYLLRAAFTSPTRRRVSTSTVFLYNIELCRVLYCWLHIYSLCCWVVKWRYADWMLLGIACFKCAKDVSHIPKKCALHGEVILATPFTLIQ